MQLSASQSNELNLIFNGLRNSINKMKVSNVSVSMSDSFGSQALQVIEREVTVLFGLLKSINGF
jgi:hypothetical protein